MLIGWQQIKIIQIVGSFKNRNNYKVDNFLFKVEVKLLKEVTSILLNDKDIRKFVKRSQKTLKFRKQFDPIMRTRRKYSGRSKQVSTANLLAPIRLRTSVSNDTSRFWCRPERDRESEDFCYVLGAVCSLKLWCRPVIWRLYFIYFNINISKKAAWI